MKHIFTSLLLLKIIIFSSVVFADDAPTIIDAKADPNDLWYPYVKRPLLESNQAKERYGARLLARIKKLVPQGVQHVPWSLANPKGKDTFLLHDAVVDKYVDPKTGKRYSVLYHATTSELTTVFDKGASSIRFDVAQLTALGMGFYVAANINEAKYYGCERLRERSLSQKDLKSIVLILGVEENDKIVGKLLAPDTRPLSDSKTGESLNPKIYLARNKERLSQFVLFKNIAPYIKLISIVILPEKFGKSADRQDGYGKPVTSTEPENNLSYTCLVN